MKNNVIQLSDYRSAIDTTNAIFGNAILDKLEIEYWEALSKYLESEDGGNTELTAKYYKEMNSIIERMDNARI